MRKRPMKWLRLASLLLVSTGAMQLATCGLIKNFNPCGTILNCDPVTFNFIRSGYRGPGANPNIDLACTYPPYCQGDPFVSSTAGTTTTKTRLNGLPGAP